jgi:hypothetical protein
MRYATPLVFLLPAVSFGQTPEMLQEVERKLAKLKTAKWVLEREAPDGGFFLAPADPKDKNAPGPMLRATNGAVRALKYLDFPLLKSEKAKHAKFVLSCYDPKTGAFAEPGGKPDVAITSIGVMAAVELDIPKEKFAKAMDYLKENAKTFEEVRIGAAAVEAWGVKECPFDLKPWLKIAEDFGDTVKPAPENAREIGSLAACFHRMRQGLTVEEQAEALKALRGGEHDQGGWGKKGERNPDIESTYRVMRYLWMIDRKPRDPGKLRAFIESHRNADGGYAVKPGERSTMSGVYYATIITKWLDDLEKK